MRIAIVSINYSPELTGISVYSTGMAKYLAAEGFDADCYTAFPYYPRWAKAEGDSWVWSRREVREGVTVRRHYAYVPGKPTAVRRMLHELSFVCSATLGYLLGPRAECTVIVSPPLFLGIPIALAAKLKGSRTVFHVQDLQPDAAVELGMLRPGRLTRLFYLLERLTYRLADRVSTISQGMLGRIVAKGVPAGKVFLFRNWANDEAVLPLPRRTAYRRSWGLGERFVVLYAGNMGVKQGLESLLECAVRLQDHPDIVLLIVGDGGEKARLVERAQALGMGNVVFKPLQPLRRLARLLATADVAVVPQRAGVKDVVLPSKVGNLLGSARPIVAAAAAETELGRIVQEGECGLLVEPGNGAQMAEAILALRGDPALCARLGQNGRAHMERHLASAAVLGGFLRELLALASEGDAGESAAETV